MTGVQVLESSPQMWKSRKSQTQKDPVDLGLIGAAGWIARLHLSAIRDSGNRLVVAMDPSDSGIAVLDDFFPDAEYVTNEAAFEAYLQRRASKGTPLTHVGICSPDYLHSKHIGCCLAQGATAICEKPLVIDPAQLDALEKLERDSDGRIRPISQHRYNPGVADLRRLLDRDPRRRLQIEITYIAHRGAWYLSSWRGDPTKSGGVAMDIGIHFFDLLTWLFGEVEHSEVHLSTPRALAGFLRTERAETRWFLSIDNADLPAEIRKRGIKHLRSFRVDGKQVDLSQRMDQLHRQSYEEVLAGRGLTIADVRPGLELAYAIQRTDPSYVAERAHPLARERSSAS